MPKIDVCGIPVGDGSPLVLIAGPCVIESEDEALALGRAVRDIAHRLGMPYIFKASFDKANRSSHRSFRGPGLEAGLAVLRRIKAELGVPVLSDVHCVSQVAAAKEVLDVIQIPAFLCRQTDLVCAAAATGVPVNVKKGQFLAPQDVANILAKVREAGGAAMITERGTTFGYHNLVVDMRALPIMRAMGCPVVFDATHSVQLPGAGGASSSGQSQYVPYLARAAAAAGIDALFLEVHFEPSRALSDGPNMLRVDALPGLLAAVLAIDAVVRKYQ